jgi:hypothetical protein
VSTSPSAREGWSNSGETLTVEVVDEDTVLEGRFPGNVAWVGAQLSLFGENPVDKVREVHGNVAGTEWTDLLPLINPARDGFSGRWEMDKDGLKQLDDRDAGHMLLLPVGVPESHEMELVFTKLSGGESMNFRFPVGERNPSFTLAGFPHEGYATVIKTIDDRQPDGRKNPTYIPAEKLENNREYRFNLAVRIEDENVSISSHLDGEWLLSWTGELGQVRHGYKEVYFARSLAIGSYAGAVRFSSIRVRALENRGLSDPE